MIPCFLRQSADDSCETLYGMYTPPDFIPGRTPCGAAVVLCPPWGAAGKEPALVHQLALKLAGRGIPSLRLDYRGTGNSLGAVSLSAWQEDIRTAGAELRSRSGLEKIVLCGAGLGASLAFLAGRAETDCSLIVLLDPVISGAEFLDTLNQQDRVYRASISGAPRRIFTANEEEIAGIMAPRSFVQELSKLDLAEDRAPVIPALVLLTSSLRTEYDRFSAFHRSRSVAIRREHFDESSGMDSLAALVEEEVF